MHLQPHQLPECCDVIIAGSGAGALCAALTASHAGLSVLIAEKEAFFGGASARSGGGLWLPGNTLCSEPGHHDSREEAETYLEHLAGPLFDPARVGAFLDNAPAMLDFVIEKTPIKFLPLSISDYYPHRPGGRAQGRSIMAASLNVANYRYELARLRPALKVSTFAGIQVGIEDFAHFSRATRNLRSFAYVLKRMAASAADLIRHRRNTRLNSGNALVAGLAIAAQQMGARIATNCPVVELSRSGDRVDGVIIEWLGQPRKIVAKRAVIIATGGFPHDGKRRAALSPKGLNNSEAWSMLPLGNTGDGLRIAERIGAQVEENMKSAIALAPLSRIDAHEGQVSCFPIFATRGNPGKIAVLSNGRRFTNEAASYHDFASALLRASSDNIAAAWIISDHRSLVRYGLGAAHPGLPVRPHVVRGYLKRGATLSQLADETGIDGQALQNTVARFNAHARSGHDPDFGRGNNDYDLWAGDPAHAPCPCLGPLEIGPFYALRVFAGAVGTFAGLKTNASAQVLDSNGRPILGLYAVGNDQASITGGDYVAGGCTLGPAMTFGYIAGRHIAGGG